MSKAVLILAVVCCFLAVSSSIGGALYWFRCDLELVDCPEPEPEKVPEPKKVKGCMDSTATNYSPEATEDDGSCLFDRKAVMTFTANDGTPGCFITKGNYIQFDDCSPELEQTEIDVITNSAGDITDVKTCFYPFKVDENSNYIKSEGDECKKYKIGEPDTIDGVPIYVWGDAPSPGNKLKTITEKMDHYVPVKLQLI